MPRFWSKTPHSYFVDDSLLWREERYCVVFDQNLGHEGEQAVLSYQRKILLATSQKDIRHHVRSCHQCQIWSTIKIRFLSQSQHLLHCSQKFTWISWIWQSLLKAQVYCMCQRWPFQSYRCKALIKNDSFPDEVFLGTNLLLIWSNRRSSNRQWIRSHKGWCRVRKEW